MYNNLSSLHSAEIFSAQSAPRMAKADFLGLWVYVLAQPGFGRTAKNLPLLSPPIFVQPMEEENELAKYGGKYRTEAS